MLTRCSAPHNTIGKQALDVDTRKGLHSFKILSAENFSMFCTMQGRPYVAGHLCTWRPGYRKASKKKKKPWLSILAISFQVATE